MVSSHLTRQVFQRLISNQPIIHRGCLRKRPCGTPPIYRRNPLGHGSVLGMPQRRHFFNLNMMGNRRRENRGADLAPGIEKMTDFVKRQRVRARLPSRDELAAALLNFLNDRNKYRKSIEDTQASLALQSLKYCMEPTESPIDARTKKMLDQILDSALKALSFPHPTGGSHAHVELGEFIFNAVSDAPEATRLESLNTYCRILADQGQWRKAQTVIQTFEKHANKVGVTGPAQDPQPGKVNTQNKQDEGRNDGTLCSVAWMDLLRSVTTTGTDSAYSAVYDSIRKRNLHRLPQAVTLSLEHSLKGNNLESVRRSWKEYSRLDNNQVDAAQAQATKTWQTNQKLVSQNRPTHVNEGITVSKLLQWCVNRGEIAFGNEVVSELLGTNPSKGVWDAIFVWAVANGKGADEIDRMIGVMEQSNHSLPNRAQWRTADISTINELVSYAIHKGDPYMAERFISLGRQRNIEPNHKTFALQMVYRIDVKDIDGALTAYKNLQALHENSTEEIPIINKLIRALVDSPVHDFDTVMNVAADLSDRQAQFEAATVSKLATLHMSRDEMHDVIDLLNTHASEFSSTERSCIAEALVAFCLDSESMTAQSWEVYSILRETFDETHREQRTKIMMQFFRRHRPDMAVNVFHHMRAHSRADTIPTSETYIAAFSGIAELQDIDSLEVVHNQLKLDYNINPDTALRNALMSSYTACGNPRKALQTWDQLVASKEGPNYNSIHLALRACEQSTFGDVKAKEIWDSLERRKVDLNASLWASYASAVVGNGKIDEAIAIVRRAINHESLVVDPFLLGSLCSAATDEVKLEQVESWAKEDHPAVWAILQAGIVTDSEGRKVYPVDRKIAL